MKNTKKVLSVVLAVVMAFSALSIVAFAKAFTIGEEINDSTVNIKYEVTQVSDIVMPDESGSYSTTAGDIYAVTVYAKCTAGIVTLSSPIFYNGNHFDAIQLIDDEGNLYFKGDTGEATGYLYKYGKQWTDTSAYKADGSVATTKALAKYIGLGKTAWATAVEPTIAMYDSSDAIWGYHGYASVPAGYSEVYCSITESGVLKNAYFNAWDNQILANEYVEIITLYFQRKAGVSEADCYGDIFGVVNTTDTNDVDCVADACGKASLQAASQFVNATNNVNIVNAAVEAPVKPLVALTAANGAKQQGLAFNLATGATKTYTESDIASVDYRFVAQFSTTAFTLEYDTDGKITNTNLDEVGFVLTRTDSGVSAADIAGYTAAQVSALSKDSGDVRKCWTTNLSTGMAGGAAFAFTCRIKGIGAADSSQPLVGTFSADNVAPGYIAVPYVLDNDGHIYFGQAMSVLKADILSRYTNNVNTFLTKANAAA